MLQAITIERRWDGWYFEGGFGLTLELTLAPLSKEPRRTRIATGYTAVRLYEG
jgi:hypothetical protein